ncbi:MAG: DsbC family protein [Betaproteobacteria bacterium]|nr:DsbC family protein [Betaproteobacteria bacterium]
MRNFALFLALLFAAGASPAADEALIRRAVEAKLNGTRIDGVVAAPGGWYEVRFRTPDGVRILYTDEKATHIFSGNIFELKSDRDLTEERLRKLNAIDFKSLPLDLAVKVQRGTGKRTVAMFSDPYCPACRNFERELLQVNDVTIYVFMFPVIRPENADHSRGVWCSEDRSKAWLDLALRGKAPSAKPTCDNPVDKVLALGRTLGVGSTPTLIMANGERFKGGMSADMLRAALDDAAKGPAGR